METLVLENVKPLSPDELLNINGGNAIGDIKAGLRDFISNPLKVAELKILLSALAHETPYEEELRLIVSKLDLFLNRLLPYLK